MPEEVLRCNRCRKQPHEISEYRQAAAAQSNLTPAEYVWREEGTLNRSNGHFLCTACYIAEGMPSGPRGWIAP